MPDYRDDREAARARIETLEAKVRERDAALEARNTEIAELQLELDHLRGNPAKRPRGVPLLAVAATIMAAGIAGTAFGLTMRAKRPPAVCPSAAPLLADPAPTLASPEPVPSFTAAPEPAPSSTDAPAPSSTAGIAEAIAHVRPQVRRCYSHELDAHPKLAGRIMVALTVSGGKVSKVALQPTSMRTPTFDACVTKVFSGLALPVDDGEIHVPFVFQSN